MTGAWETVGQHPYFSEAELHGEVHFEWIEGGAFMKMTSTIDHPKFPDGVSIFGSDNERDKIYILYFDERGVSRQLDFSMEGKQFKWWHDSTEFAQRFTVDVSEDRNTMVGHGHMRRNGGDWEKDLDLTYTRVTK